MPCGVLSGAVFYVMERYSIIAEKQPREIVLLRGTGCVYKHCTFCDYHTDGDPDTAANFRLNQAVLDRVTGVFGELEVINSGSVFELDVDTLDYIRLICFRCGITVVHFEAHALYRDRIEALRQAFAPIDLRMKLGLETFDPVLREDILHKGIVARAPDEIARGFDEANLLAGLDGQTAQSMLYDIETALQHFRRVCVNLMCENSTAVKPNPAAVAAFMRDVYPRYVDDRRVDILVNNTDFGVGD